MMIYVGKRFSSERQRRGLGTSCDQREQSRRGSDRRYFSVVRSAAGTYNNTQRVYGLFECTAIIGIEEVTMFVHIQTIGEIVCAGIVVIVGKGATVDEDVHRRASSELM